MFNMITQILPSAVTVVFSRSLSSESPDPIKRGQNTEDGICIQGVGRNNSSVNLGMLTAAMLLELGHKICEFASQPGKDKYVDAGNIQKCWYRYLKCHETQIG